MQQHNAIAGLFPLLLTLKLAAVTTVVLLIVGTPFAWWLANTKSKSKVLLEAVVSLPLILPPTVLGFYLLILLGPKGIVGEQWLAITGETLTFSFLGLVISSCVYSLPFVVQPLQNAFEALDGRMLAASRTLGASPFAVFTHVAIPNIKRGLLTASVLGFAHTIGEFGVVLMVGGNIPGQTRVISIAIYDHVESLNFAAAHKLSALLLVFSFATLVIVYSVNRKARLRSL